MLLLAHCFLLWHIPLLNFWSRSSRPEVFSKKGVLRNFAKFIGKCLCPSLFFHKVAGLRPPTLLKKRLGHGCFPMNFAKFLRIPLFIDYLRWLLLSIPFWITTVEIFLFKIWFLTAYINAYSKRYKRWNKSKQKCIFACLRCWCWRIHVFLIHYNPVLLFYTPWKHQKT